MGIIKLDMPCSPLGVGIYSPVQTKLEQKCAPILRDFYRGASPSTLGAHRYFGGGGAQVIAGMPDGAKAKMWVEILC